MSRSALVRAVWSLFFLLLNGTFNCGLLAMDHQRQAHNPSPAAWTIEDLLAAETASQWAVSSDGRLAVWVHTAVVKVEDEEKRLSNLRLSRLGPASSETEANAALPAIALTRGQQVVSVPAFSPNSRYVAFLSTRDLPGGSDGNGDVAKTQLWVIPVSGGEAYPVTRSARDIRGFDWRDDETLVVMAQELPSAYEASLEKRGDTSTVVDDEENEPPVRLFSVARKEGAQLQRLTHNTDRIQTLAVAPDGRHAVVVAEQSLRFDFDEKIPPQTHLVDLESGELSRLFDDPQLPRNRWLLPTRLAWAPDSAGFYLLNQFSNHAQYRMATVEQVWYHDVASGETEQVELDWPAGTDGVIAPVPGGVIALMAAGVERVGMLYTRDTGGGGDSGADSGGGGWLRQPLAGAHVSRLDDLLVSRDGATVVYRHSTATVPPQWFTARCADRQLQEVRRLTDLNPDYRDKPTGKVEVVRWTGARGEQVEGLLHWPLPQPGGPPAAARSGSAEGPAPLIVDIHGGPSSADRDTWSQSFGGPLLLFRQRGAFVLQVNYHGSTGYGLEWVESIGDGNYYDLETVDIERGVDAMIERGIADPERLALFGWSNGGILAADLVTRTDRYRAASIGAADVEWFSDWANVDFGAAFDNYYFGGPPWEEVETYLEKSPFFRLREVTTPTIVFAGTADRAVPPHQSWNLFRALQYLERTPVRLVLFPNEPHTLQKQMHRQRKVEEDLAWFDRYLFGREQSSRPWLRADSRLAGLLGRQRVAHSEEGVGVHSGGVLCPETVHFAGMEVGRFEVTRAQWAAFSGEAVEAGNQDLPVAGVSYEQAKAYADWLQQRTGRPFRLPTEREAKRLASAAGKGGNTLDHWAGYSPNPEDAERLLDEVESVLGDRGKLLLPVGSLPGKGDDPVFDLDGNVAEWAQGETGGAVVGASADRPAKALGAEASAAYVGLRVVVAEAGGGSGS